MTQKEAIEWLTKLKGDAVKYIPKNWDKNSKALDMAVDALKKSKGKWLRVCLEDNKHAFAFYRCSECGKDTLEYTYFCPNCGADLRREK